MSTAYVSTVALADFRGVLAGLGVGSEDLQMGEPSLRQRSGGSLKLATFVALLERIGQTERRSDLCWQAGQATCYGTRGQVGTAVLSARTLGTALTRLTTYFPLIQDSTALELEVRDDWATLGYRILDPDIWPRHEDAMYSLGIYASLIRSAAQDAWDKVELTVEAEASFVRTKLCNIVQTNVVYGGTTNALRFPAALLHRPLAQPVPSDAALLADLNRKLVAKRRSIPLSTRVREMIFREMNEGLVNQEFVARALGVSSRTLRRKLAAENLSYQELLDECRMRYAALEFRTRERLSLSELALKLGYSEHSTFSRAFVRWAGMPPQEYRRRAMAS